MSVELHARRAARALERDVGAIPVPAPSVAVARARRHRARTVAGGVATVVAVLVSIVLVVTTGNPESSPPAPDAISPDAMELQHFDAVRSLLTVDAADVRYDREHGDQALRTTARHLRVQRCMGRLGYQVPDLLTADFLIAGGRGFRGFEDLDALRAQGIQGRLPDTPYQRYLGALANPGAASTPAATEELGNLQACGRNADVTDLRAEVSDVRNRWLSAVAAQEDEPAVANARATVAPCLRARGYAVTVDADGEAAPVTDGSLALPDGTPADAQARSLAIGRDLADCLEPLVAARTTAHRRARETFLAQHGAELAALQQALDDLVERLRAER